MIRTVVTPINNDLHLILPNEYIGRKIEISYFPLDDISTSVQNSNISVTDLWNTISDETAEKLHNNINEMRKEWD